MSRQAQVYFEKELAGTLEETDEGYRFSYLANYQGPAVSLTLPLRQEAYESKILFPFFDNLIPEGWLLHLVESNWKVNPRDRMGLLLSLCEDTIGAISIKEKQS